MIWIPILLGVAAAAVLLRQSHDRHAADAIVANRAAELHIKAAAQAAQASDSAAARAHVDAAQVAIAVAATKTTNAADAATTDRQKRIATQLAAWTAATHDSARAILAFSEASSRLDHLELEENRMAMRDNLEAQKLAREAIAAALARQTAASAALAALGAKV